MKKLGIFSALALVLALQAGAETTHITTPAEQFGFEPGTDRKLADWKELVPYYQKVAGESDRVRFQELGKTMEGRPFVMLTISSPENLAHLAEYKEIVTKLSDPRNSCDYTARGSHAETQQPRLIEEVRFVFGVGVAAMF
jgi:hypothetical protein